MSSFNCEHCNTPILDTEHGYITECEHYPLEQLKPQPRNNRYTFLRVLAEFARDDNPVTKASHRAILKNRLDRGDLT